MKQNITRKIGTIVSIVILIMIIGSVVIFGWTDYLWIGIFDMFYIFFVGNFLAQKGNSEEVIIKFW